MDYEHHQSHSNGASWLSGSNFLTRVMGFSFFASMLQSNSYMVDSIRLFLLGTIIETGRRFCQWLIERFWFRQYKLMKKSPVIDAFMLFGRILHNRAIHWRWSCLWVDHSFSCMSSILLEMCLNLWSFIDSRKRLEAILRVQGDSSVFAKEMGCPSESPCPIPSHEQ